MCSIEPDAVFAVHSDDERPRETAGTRHGVEESVRDAGLGVCGDGLSEAELRIQRSGTTYSEKRSPLTPPFNSSF